MLNTFNVKDKTCKANDCKTLPTFGLTDKPTHCAKHKTSEIFNVKDKNVNLANVMFIIQHLIKGRFCGTHKLENMINVKNKCCEFDGCMLQPAYGFEDGSVQFCKKHKKENMVELKEKFPDLSWYEDKIIYDGCSKRRPDLFLDLGNQVIIVEIDEDQHKGYTCENKRLMEISQDIHHRPLVFICFNPDAYINIDNIKISSCWKLNHLGILILNDKVEWKSRLSKLKKEIKYWLNNETTKTIEVIELFYT